jgi:hypothetical protein
MKEDIKLISHITMLIRTGLIYELKNSHFVYNAGWTDEEYVEEVILC